MMTFGLALLLAIIQGLTEFLPVSSKAHLSLMQIFSGSFTEPPVLFDVWLHLATLVAVLVFYRKKLKDYFRPDNFKALIAATILTGIVGLALKPFAERAFGSLTITGVLLFCTGLYMFITQRLWPAAHKPLDLKRAGLIGLIQGFCVFPGLSRSGWTICTGVNLGLEPGRAAEFSFILSVPTIAMANALEFWQHRKELGAMYWDVYAAAFIVAFVVGLATIAVFTRLIVRRHLTPFAVYCMVLGAAVLAYYAGRTLS